MARHGTVMEWYRIELNEAVKEKIRNAQRSNGSELRGSEAF